MVGAHLRDVRRREAFRSGAAPRHQGASTARRAVEAETEAAARAGARLVTVLDEDYPANLRLIPNLPPFLFYRGDLAAGDTWSVAVVGTRKASESGIEQAARLSRLLAGHDVTIISGLARGIDTAAHQAALDSGGRTIAVLGTGITRCYPPENQGLSEQIAQAGALVSRFWPTRAPGRDTFPRRNVVTSGLSQGTVVIEASQTSGAKMQARLALEHDKKVFLVASLVADQPWSATTSTAGTRSRLTTFTRCSSAWPPRTGSGRRPASSSSSP